MPVVLADAASGARHGNNSIVSALDARRLRLDN
jgi:hypothetical protein